MTSFKDELGLWFCQYTFLLRSLDTLRYSSSTRIGSTLCGFLFCVFKSIIVVVYCSRARSSYQYSLTAFFVILLTEITIFSRYLFLRLTVKNR